MDKGKKGREGEGVVPKKIGGKERRQKVYKAIVLMNNCVKLLDLVASVNVSCIDHTGGARVSVSLSGGQWFFLHDEMLHITYHE